MLRSGRGLWFPVMVFQRVLRGGVIQFKEPEEAKYQSRKSSATVQISSIQESRTWTLPGLAKQCPLIRLQDLDSHPFANLSDYAARFQVSVKGHMQEAILT